MMSEGAMRLSNFPDLRPTSFGELEGLLAAKGLQAERVGPGESARFNTVHRAGWYLAHIDYEMAVRIRAPAERGDYTLYLPVVGVVRATDGREVVAADGAQGAVASPHRPITTLISAGASRINLSIGRETLMRHLAALLGEEPARPPVFALALDRSRPQCRSYLQHLWGVIAALEEDAGFLDRPLVGAAVEQALIAGLLQTQPHDGFDRLASAAGPAPADVKRVVDYIHAHLAEEILLADLAQAARAPARTLQRHFQARFGCGPMRYLRDRRLCRAREELLRADEATSVTDVALRWGFGSLGRFAGFYRARFGESPSQTLRRVRTLED